MLWFERQVVGTLMSPTLDASARAAVESYVATTLQSMPEHLRAGVAAESIVLGGWSWLENRIGRLDDAPPPHARHALEDEQDRPDPPVRPAAASHSCCSPRTSSSPDGAVNVRPPADTIDTDVLIIGSGAGGAVTAATLARAGRTVTVLEEGPWVDPDALEPFSLQEMVAKYRHGGSCAALGRPAIAYAEGRCVGGSTEINSGLYHRLPPELAEEWQRDYQIDEFGTDALDRYARTHRARARRLAPARRAARVVGGARTGRDQARLAFGRVLARVPLRAERPGGEADDGAHAAAERDRRRRARRSPTAACARLVRAGSRIVGATCEQTLPDGTTRATPRARRPRVRVRGRDADARAAAAQRYSRATSAVA